MPIINKMKVNIHRKSNSEKILLRTPRAKNIHDPNCDPFEKMTASKKKFPLLKPICHKRLTIDDPSKKLNFCESARNLDLRPSKVVHLFSPKVTFKLSDSDAIFCLAQKKNIMSCEAQVVNPLFQKNKICERRRVSNGDSYGIIKMVRKVNDRNKSYKTKSVQSNFDFSFGK